MAEQIEQKNEMNLSDKAPAEVAAMFVSMPDESVKALSFKEKVGVLKALSAYCRDLIDKGETPAAEKFIRRQKGRMAGLLLSDMKIPMADRRREAGKRRAFLSALLRKPGIKADLEGWEGKTNEERFRFLNGAAKTFCEVYGLPRIPVEEWTFEQYAAHGGEAAFLRTPADEKDTSIPPRIFVRYDMLDYSGVGLLALLTHELTHYHHYRSPKEPGLLSPEMADLYDTLRSFPKQDYPFYDASPDEMYARNFGAQMAKKIVKSLRLKLTLDDKCHLAQMVCDMKSLAEEKDAAEKEILGLAAQHRLDAQLRDPYMTSRSAVYGR